jgi:hypothetical protein
MIAAFMTSCNKDNQDFNLPQKEEQGGSQGNKNDVKLQLSTTQLNMQVGKTESVKIVKGNGKYSCKITDNNIATATLENNIITVNPLSTGNTELIVTDDNSKEQVKVSIVVSQAGTPNPTPGETEETTKTIFTFNFSENPWKVPTTNSIDAKEDKTAGKLDDDVKMVTGPVTLTQKKNSDRYWNRIIDNIYTVYKENAFTFTAEEGKFITRIEFINVPYYCNLTYNFKNLICNNDDDFPYIWTGKEKTITFNAVATSKFNEIKVTVE